MALKYVICATCDGAGLVHRDDGSKLLISLFEDSYECSDPGVAPCYKSVPCPDCGHGECGPGVRRVETRNDLVASEVAG